MSKQTVGTIEADTSTWLTLDMDMFANDSVVLNDENGEHEPMTFYPNGGKCVPHGEWERLSQTQERRRMYCDCGYELGVDKRDSFPFERTEYAPMPRFCPECGVKLVSKGKAVKR